MKAKVYVSLKSGVLDPQGKAIQHSVELLGYSGISDVRQGKYFEIALDGSVDNSEARQSVDKIAREVLSIPCFAELTDDEVEQVADAVRLACERV